MPREVCILLRRFPFFFLAGFFLLDFLPGVAGAFSLSHPDLAARMSNVKAIGLVTPDVRIYELTAGGVSEIKEDWSARAKENVTRSLLERFPGKLVEVKKDALETSVREDMEDVLALYSIVVGSYIVHAEGPNAFPVKRDVSAYTLGSLEGLFAALKVDALLVVYGSDRISTGGRKALTVLGMVGGVLLTPGVTVMNIGLLDKSGSVLWYNSKGSVVGGDFREPEGAAKFTGETLTGFPGLPP